MKDLLKKTIVSCCILALLWLQTSTQSELLQFSEHFFSLLQNEVILPNSLDGWMILDLINTSLFHTYVLLVKDGGLQLA